MSTAETGINVEVTGPADSGKTLVCTVIAKALTKAGFTEVTMTDQQGGVVEPGDTRTMLDLVAQQRPEILATPISVIETTEVEEIGGDDVIELSDVTVRITDDDGTLDEILSSDPQDSEA